MNLFYYAVGDERRGPVTEDALLDLLRTRTVTVDTLVWSDGMTDWLPLGTARPHWVAEGVTLPPPAASESATCAVTGRLLPKSGMIQFGDVWVSPEGRDVYLQRLQEGRSTTDVSFEPATIWQRFAGNFIDGLIIGLPVVGVVVGVTMLSEATPSRGDLPVLSNLAIAGTAIIASAIYEILMISSKGATLGKMAMKTHVIDANDRMPGWGTATGRWALKSLVQNVPMIGAIYTLISIVMTLVDQPWHRAIHDRGARTRVVQRRR